MKNTIFLKRANKLIVQKGGNTLPDVFLATALKNIENLGFTFSAQLMKELKTLSIEDFGFLYHDVIHALKEMVGDHVTFSPMYPDFPKQVMEMEEGELYLRAVIHYLGSTYRDITGEDVSHLTLSKTEKEERGELLDTLNLKVIDLGTEEEFNAMMKRLIGAKTSVSQSDKEDISWVIKTTEKITSILPEEIPSKENLAYVVSELLTHKKANAGEISPYFKTATDVLRFVTALSDGDVSLAANTRFKKLKRSERRLILNLLENCKSLEEDMLRHKNKWKALNGILHPGEHQKKYPKAYRAFDVVVNDKAFETFGSRLEKALLLKDGPTALSLLKTRPGDFARRLDHVLRFANPLVTVASFSGVVDKVATPVVMQVLTHFKRRGEESDIRTFFPKGDVAKAVAIENQLPQLSEDITSRVVSVCEDSLIRRFSELSPLGKTYIDPALKDYVVPFSQRSASKALRTLVRGTKLNLPEADTVRFFLWWKEGMADGEHTGRVDIDLSAVLYNESWNYQEEISFRDLRSHGAVHSGDITSAPKGAAEFIDLTIPTLLEKDVRYIAMSINSYSDHPFSALPECFAGWMSVEDEMSGKIFEPSRVKDKIDLASDTQISIPVIIDIVDRKVIWCDLALKHHPNHVNAVTENAGGLALMGKSMVELKKPNLYDLFYLHAASRGELTDDISEAEKVFSITDGTTPFDIEEIMSEYI